MVVWGAVVVVLAFDAGCGGRSGLQLFAQKRSDGGTGAQAGTGGAGGVAATGGSVAGRGGTGLGGRAGSGAAGGGMSAGGNGAGSGRSGSAGQGGNGGSAGVAGSGGSESGSAGTVGAGTAGAGGQIAGAGGEGGEGGEASAPDATAVAVGAFHSCAAFDDGRLRCWGAGGYTGSGDELMIGDDETPSAIPPIEIGGDVLQMDAGWYHTCAVLPQGNVRCFGNANDGRLGYGNPDDIGDDETPASAGDVDLGGGASQVSVGPQHSCARLLNRTVRCWGDNSGHQLGYPGLGTIGDDESPATAGDVDVGGFVRQVVVGFSHTCALLQGGRVRCWGQASGGRLGYGNADVIGDDETPSQAGDLDLGGVAVTLAAGSFHTCALLANGSVRCWGFPTYGTLGYGTLDVIGDDETPAQAGDVDVGGTVIQIAAGAHATCALLDDGAVRCWGRALEGELGYGNAEDIGDDETPASAGNIEVGGPATSIDVGFLNVCATLETGAVRCWGRGQTGALGYGNTEDIGDDETPASAGDVELWP
jgi:alpha-tubulin suppressor-like RCC1 family protein